MHNKAELLDYLRRRERQGEGYAALGELADAYPGARQDLEVGSSRMATGNLWLILMGVAWGAAQQG